MDAGGIIPVPGKLADHLKNPQFTGWTWVTEDLADTALGLAVLERVKAGKEEILSSEDV